MLKKGNWLWTELPETEAIYCCKLFFLYEKVLQELLEKHSTNEVIEKEIAPYFIIRNDTYLSSCLNSLSTMNK
ncbi:MAG: hypothetical protein WA749_02580 [Gelidibacter sp.]